MKLFRFALMLNFIASAVQTYAIDPSSTAGDNVAKNDIADIIDYLQTPMYAAPKIMSLHGCCKIKNNRFVNTIIELTNCSLITVPMANISTTPSFLDRWFMPLVGYHPTQNVDIQESTINELLQDAHCMGPCIINVPDLFENSYNANASSIFRLFDIIRAHRGHPLIFVFSSTERIENIDTSLLKENRIECQIKIE